MKVAIRVDSSYKMGSGHLMRCLTLADGLRERGCNVSFLCRELPGNMIGYLDTKRYKVHRLPYLEEKKNELSGDLAHSDWLGVDWQTDAVETKSIIEKDGCTDCLIVDHYALDRRWEEQMRPFAKRIMIIDDLADRPHDCDLLLDQNYYINMGGRYKGLISKNCKPLLGPQYALLRKQFIDELKTKCERHGVVNRILIFLGGVDPTNETAKALEAIRLLNRPEIETDVVVGGINPHKNMIEELCAKIPNTHFHYQVDNMAQLMVNADLAIGAGGATTWERFCIGLPTIVISIAKNQVDTTNDLAAKGFLFHVGWFEEVDAVLLCKCIRELLNNRRLLDNYSTKSMELVDGLGVERVIEYISNIDRSA